MSGQPESFPGGEEFERLQPLSLHQDAEMLRLATFGRPDFEVCEPWIETLNDIAIRGDLPLKGGAGVEFNHELHEAFLARQELLREFGWLSEESPVYSRIERCQKKAYPRLQRTSYVIENLRTLYENAGDEMMVPVRRDAAFIFSNPRKMRETTAITRALGYDNKLLFKLRPYLFIKYPLAVIGDKAEDMLDHYTAQQERAQRAQSRAPRYKRTKEAFSAESFVGLEYDKDRDMLSLIAAARFEDPNFAVTPEWVDSLNRLIASGSRQLPQNYTLPVARPFAEERRELANEIRRDRCRLFEEFGWLSESPAYAIPRAEKYFNVQAKNLSRSDYVVDLLTIFYEYLGKDMMVPIRADPALIVKLRPDTLRDQLQIVDGVSGKTAADFLRHRSTYLYKYGIETLRQKTAHLWEVWQAKESQSAAPFSLARDAGWLALAANSSDAGPGQVHIDRLNDLWRRHNSESKDTGQFARDLFEALGWIEAGAPLPGRLIELESLDIDRAMRNMRELHTHLGDLLMVAINQEPRLLRKVPETLRKALQAVGAANYSIDHVLRVNPGFFVSEPLGNLAKGKDPLVLPRQENRPEPKLFKPEPKATSAGRPSRIPLGPEVPPASIFSLARDAGWLALAAMLEPKPEIGQAQIDRLNQILHDYHNPSSGNKASARDIYSELGWVMPQEKLPPHLIAGELANVDYVMRNMRTLHAHLGELLMPVVVKEVRLLKRIPRTLHRAFQATTEAGYSVKDVLRENPGFFLSAPIEKLRTGKNPLEPPKPRRPLNIVKKTHASPKVPRSSPKSQGRSPGLKSPVSTKAATPSSPQESIEIPINPYIALKEAFSRASSSRLRSLDRLARKYLSGQYRSGVELIEAFPDLLTYSPAEFYKAVSPAVQYYFHSEEPSEKEFARRIRAYIARASQAGTGD